MLSRVYISSTQVARASSRAMGACRHMATQISPPPPPPSPAAKAPTPPQQAPNTKEAAKAPPAQASKVPPKASKSGKLSKYDFSVARLNLPLRLYSKHGILASRLYVLGERAGKGEVDKVATSIAALHKELLAYPKLNAFLASPANTPDQKKILLTKLSTLLKLNPVLSSFLTDLATERKAKLIPKIAKEFLSLMNARDKIVNVTLTVASTGQPKPATETIQKALKYSKDTKIVLSVVVDPKIEGGAILASKDKFLDRSFRREITALKAKLAKEETDVRAKKRAQFLAALSQVENAVEAH
jgi:F0F1-type ATP synthase delta subunit